LSVDLVSPEEKALYSANQFALFGIVAYQRPCLVGLSFYVRSGASVPSIGDRNPCLLAQPEIRKDWIAPLAPAVP